MPYRRLGLRPGASREVARRHFRCLLRWLHPDVNNGWDAVYAERVLSAWREVSAQLNASSVPGGPATEWSDPLPDERRRAIPTNVRVPWIRNPTSSGTQASAMPASWRNWAREWLPSLFWWHWLLLHGAVPAPVASLGFASIVGFSNDGSPRA